LRNRFVIPFVACLLGIALLSNRALPLRQLPVRIEQQSSFHLPADKTGSSRVHHGPLLIAVSDEGISDLRQTPRNAMAIVTVPVSPIEERWAYVRLQSVFLHRVSVYLLQPVLNL